MKKKNDVVMPEAIIQAPHHHAIRPELVLTTGHIPIRIGFTAGKATELAYFYGTGLHILRRVYKEKPLK